MARTAAKKPLIGSAPQTPCPAITSAPTIVIPLIAFEPDIRGVCSVGGTFVMISKPTKTASTKIVKFAIRSEDAGGGEASAGAVAGVTTSLGDSAASGVA